MGTSRLGYGRVAVGKVTSRGSDGWCMYVRRCWFSRFGSSSLVRFTVIVHQRGEEYLNLYSDYSSPPNYCCYTIFSFRSSNIYLAIKLVG